MSHWQRARAMARELESQGWTVEPTRGGHLRATHPGASGPMFLARTPSDSRNEKNVRALAARLLRGAK